MRKQSLNKSLDVEVLKASPGNRLLASLDIEAEYALIMQKKSKLSASQREYVINSYNFKMLNKNSKGAL